MGLHIFNCQCASYEREAPTCIFSPSHDWAQPCELASHARQSQCLPAMPNLNTHRLREFRRNIAETIREQRERKFDVDEYYRTMPGGGYF